jgi:RHS repeat-associated protein
VQSADLAAPRTAAAAASAMSTCSGATIPGNPPNVNNWGLEAEASLPFPVDFGDEIFTSVKVRNQGYVYFGTYDPMTDLGVPVDSKLDFESYGQPMIAPFFTLGSSSTPSGGPTTTYGETTYNGHAAFCVRWEGWFNWNMCLSTHPTDPYSTNTLQMLIVDRSDAGQGDFDIVFQYDQVQWDHQNTPYNDPYGSGPCGDAAVAGWKSGSGGGTVIEGAFTLDAYLDGGSHALVSNSLGSTTPGEYVWNVRNGNGTVPYVPPAQTNGPCQPSGSPVAVNPSGCQADPVNTATGNYHTSTRDLQLGGAGITFQFARTYNSAESSASTLGVGWTDNLDAKLNVQANGDVLVRSGTGQQALFGLNPDGTYSPPAGGRASLSATEGGGWLLTTRSREHQTFNAFGQLTGHTDRNGQGLSLSYNADGTLAAVIDAAQRRVTLAYNVAGQLDSVTLPDGRYVGYTYDVAGHLRTVRDARGGTTTYEYNAWGLLSRIVDQNNNTVVENTYDPDTGRVIAQQNGLGDRSTFGWDQAAQVATFTDARANTWKDIYDGNVLSGRIDPLGHRTAYVYDQDANVIAAVDENGKATKMTYDARGNILTRTAPAPLSYEETWTYNAFDEPLTYTNARRKTTEFGYDAVGNLTSITQPDPDGTGPLGRPVTRFGLDAAGTGSLASVTNPRNKTTVFDYDADGNLSSMTSPLGAQTTLGYDASGRLTSVVNPRGNASGANASEYTTTYSYDDADHRETVTDALDHTTTTSFDPGGRLQSTTDANNHTTSFGYDAANHLKSVTAPDQTQTLSDYDPTGNLIATTDANNHTTTYGYDDANRPSQKRLPSGRTWSYQRDAKGQLLDILFPDGKKIRYRHDELGRVISLYADSVLNFRFAYDENGNRKSVTCVNNYAPCPLGQHSYAYDALDRVTAVDSMTYRYDDTGNVITRTVNPSGGLTSPIQQSYDYDDDGRVRSVTAPGGTTTLGYDEASNLTTTTLPSANGYVETRGYDRANRITQVKSAKGTSVLADVKVTRDPVGNPLVTTQTGATTGTATHTYDALDRLTGVCWQAGPCTGSAGPFIRWTYDPVGNRKTETRPTGTTTSSYDVDDQLLSAGSTTYGYDLNGNQTKAGTTTNTWDGLHRLSTTTTGRTTTTFAYDADGLRVQESTGSQAASTTNYVWDPVGSVPQVVLERDGGGAPLRSYAYAARRLSMTTHGSGAGSYFYHHDQLGSVINLTSTSGATQWTNAYEPFGALRGQTKNATKAPSNSMLFVGERRDSTGRYDLRARQYDPTSGRFLAPDPVAGSRLAPHYSAYQYVQNRPTVGLDPLGLCWEPTGVTCAVGNVAADAGKFVWKNLDAIAGLAAAGVCTATAGVACGVAVVTAFALAMLAPTIRLAQGDSCGYLRELIVNSVLAKGALGILAVLKASGKDIPKGVSAWLSGPGALYSGLDLLAGFDLQNGCNTPTTGTNGK